METFQALYGRRSIREFQRGKQIPVDIVDDILRSAWYTLPLPGGSMPWRFIVARDDATKDLFADCAREVAMTMFGASFEVFGPGHLWYLPRDTQLAVAEYTASGELWEYPRDADVVFVPVMSKSGFVDTVTSFTETPELLCQYVGMASQNMWLVGHMHGIGAGYNAMPCLDIRRRETLAEHLTTPWSWEPTGAFSFGYGGSPRVFGPARPALEGVVFDEYWGNPYRRLAFGKADYGDVKVPKTELWDVLKNLNVVKSFSDKAMPAWMTERVIDAALWGPVPENFKNWRFLVVRDRESKEFLQKLVTEKALDPWISNYPELQYSRLSDVPEKDRLEVIEKQGKEGYGRWLEQADTLIIVLSCYFNWRDQPYGGLAAGPSAPLAISTGCCAQNMFIAASALGLGFNYDVLATGDNRTRDLMLEYFGIPAASWLPIGVLALGLPGEKADLKRRQPIESLVYDECWGNVYEFKSGGAL